MNFIHFPPVNMVIEGADAIRLPPMMKIRQKYAADKIDDLAAHIREEMSRNLSDKKQYQNKRICITAGSRGIPHLDLIIRTVVDELKAWGARPFIIPAMGSHGGATPAGQTELLAGYNITEESMGAPILSSFAVVQVGELADGTPVYCDKYAYESDGIVILNKIKPHTDFRGINESGLAKMLAIGLAKHQGASLFHMRGFASFPELIPQACAVLLEQAPVIFGVGIVQNAYDEISELAVMDKDRLMEQDAALLAVAKDRIAKFKFTDMDVLIIDEIGKNISGNGHDPNITGRSNSPGFDNIINCQRLFIRGLSADSHHNACGLGMADVTTRRCLNSVDFGVTWTNVITAAVPHGGKIPIYMNNDREALLLAIRTCIGIDYNAARIDRIKNTLAMHEIEVSANMRSELKGRDDIEILSEPYDFVFDADGFLW